MKEEELEIDFSKIKKWFKKKPEHKAEHKKAESEELQIDITSAKKFIKKHYVVLLLLIPILLSVWFRALPLSMPLIDNQAQIAVEQYFQNQLGMQVAQQFPNLPEANRQKLAAEQYAEFKKKNAGMIRQQTEAAARQFKSAFQDDKGQTYLLAIDPYFYMRHVKHYLDKGQAGTTYIGGSYGVPEAVALRYPKKNFSEATDWDGQRLAPIGSPTSMTFHSYFEAYLYKFISFFNRDASLMAVIFYVPIILSALAVIPAFYIGRRVGGTVGGLFSGIIVAVHSTFISRTVGGFADTDPYNVLFPLLIVWAFLEAFESKNRKKSIILAVTAGLLTGLYSFAWSGWWYISDFILGSIAVYLFYYLIMHRKDVKKGIKHLITRPAIKQTLILALTFLAATAIFVTLFTNFTAFINSFTNPITKAATLKVVGATTIWPNIQTTVAELNAASLGQTVQQMGGTLLFAFAVLGALLTIIKKDIHGKRDIKYASIILIWFVGTLYMSTQGIRFIFLMVPAFAVAIGAGAGIIYKYVSQWLINGMNVGNTTAKIVMFLLLAIMLIKPIQAGYNTASHELPSMNDVWYDTLTQINQQTPKDSIINSWWDFGHWFITIADRRVTFDGAGQDNHMAYWIGRSLLTSDENKSAGILRMVDCGNNNAFWQLNKYLNDEIKSISILNEIVVQNREEAKKILTEYITNEEAEKVLQYTHCEAPENYYITSDDMIGKAGVWSHFGSWDFNKAYIWSKTKNKPEQEAIPDITKNTELNEEEATKLYNEAITLKDSKEANSWIAPWPSYASGLQRCTENKTLNCGGIQIDLNNKTATITTPQGTIKPQAVSYYDEEKGYTEMKINSTTPIAVAIIKKEGTKYAILAQPPLHKSIFTRLYFDEGRGLTKFKQYTHKKDSTGLTRTEVYVWKVEW